MRCVVGRGSIKGTLPAGCDLARPRPHRPIPRPGMVLPNPTPNQHSRTAGELRAEMPSARIFVCSVDFTSAKSMLSAARASARALGPVWGFVHAAGFLCGKPVLALRTNDVCRSFAVNAFAPLWALRGLLPDMAAQGCGRVCLLSSLASQVPLPGLTLFGASKAAAAVLAAGLQREMRLAGHPRVTACVLRVGRVEEAGTAGGGGAHSASPRGRNRVAAPWLWPFPVSISPAALADRVVEALASDATEAYAPAGLAGAATLARALPEGAVEWTLDVCMQCGARQSDELCLFRRASDPLSLPRSLPPFPPLQATGATAVMRHHVPRPVERVSNAPRSAPAPAPAPAVAPAVAGAATAAACPASQAAAAGATATASAGHEKRLRVRDGKRPLPVSHTHPAPHPQEQEQVVFREDELGFAL